MPTDAVQARFRHARRRGPVPWLALSLAVGAGAAGILVGTTGPTVPRAREADRAAQSVAQKRPPASGGPSAARAAGAAERPRPPAEITFPDQGAGTWRLARETSSVAGVAGHLLRYQVAVERGIENVGAEEFAASVTGTLSDPRSWIGDGDVRLQRVSGGEAADFVIYLATPVTRDRLCGGSYDRYTSCRNGDKVVINVARWVNGASAVGGSLAAYRDYVVNHEVGHRLGHGHEPCPGRGIAAPVMQQQTLGLHGCRPNAWPVPDGYRIGRIPGGQPASVDSVPVPSSTRSGRGAKPLRTALIVQLSCC